MNTETTITLVIAVIGAITGILGTVLAILQHRREVESDRVHLRVGISWGLSSVDPSRSFLVIHVTNLSKFPVTIRDAGVLTRKRSWRVTHALARTPQGRLPIRMEPRTAISVDFPPEFLLSDELDESAVAYVSTACGEEIVVDTNDIPAMMWEARKQAGRK
jgi:hypothetical protein